MRRPSRLVYALLCVLAAVVCSAVVHSQQTASPSILGTYYFKGMGLMEVRQEGSEIVTELLTEKGFWASMTQMPQNPNQKHPEEEKKLMEKVAKYRHHGRLASPTRLEFDDWDATLANLLKHFDVSEKDFQPDEFAKFKSTFPSGGLGRYYERWELLPDNRLKVECAIPILNPSGNPQAEAAKAMELKSAINQAGFLDKYKEAHSADLTSVCGWKITQDAERDAWKALDGGDYGKAAQLFQSAEQAQPDRPFAYLGEAWARTGAKQFDLARKALQAGREHLPDETRPWLAKFSLFLKDQVYSYETASLGKDADYAAFMESMDAGMGDFFKKTNPELSGLTKKAIREWQAKDYQEANKAVTAFPFWIQIQKTNQMRGRGSLMPIGQGAFSGEAWAQAKVPNFLNCQQMAKLIVLKGHLSRAQRAYPQAVYQYTLAVHLGQIMRHGTMISHLIGIAMETIGLNGLLQFIEDGLLSDAPILQYTSQMMGYLDKDEPRQEPGEMLASESGLTPFISDPILEAIFLVTAVPNSEEAQTRATMVGTKIALIKAACAVKAKNLKPPFPPTMDAASLPKDPFAPEQPLRYQAAGNEALLYSVGPDKKDENAAAIYDPTNGTLSAGDVILKIR